MNYLVQSSYAGGLISSIVMPSVIERAVLIDHLRLYHVVPQVTCLMGKETVEICLSRVVLQLRMDPFDLLIIT